MPASSEALPGLAGDEELRPGLSLWELPGCQRNTFILRQMGEDDRGQRGGSRSQKGLRRVRMGNQASWGQRDGSRGASDGQKQTGHREKKIIRARQVCEHKKEAEMPGTF